MFPVLPASGATPIMIPMSLSTSTAWEKLFKSAAPLFQKTLLARCVCKVYVSIYTAAPPLNVLSEPVLLLAQGLHGGGPLLPPRYTIGLVPPTSLPKTALSRK